MDELAALRNKRLQELQRKEASEEEQLQSQVAQLDAIVKGKLDRDALTRYGNIRSAHQELWLQSLVVLAQLIQRGQQNVSDAQYKQILERLQPKKRDITIRKV